MAGSIPPDPSALQLPPREEWEAICELAGLEPGELPFGPGFLAGSIGGMPEEEGRPAAGAVLLGGTAALALLGQSARQFLQIATDNGLQAFADAAWIIFTLRHVLRTGNEDARKVFVKAARKISPAALPRQHEHLRTLADQLDEKLRAGADRAEVYALAVNWLPINAPSLCPFRTRKTAEQIAALRSYKSGRPADPVPAARFVRRSKGTRAFLERLAKADGEALVKLAAGAHGVPRAKVKHLFDAEDKRAKRPKSKRAASGVADK